MKRRIGALAVVLTLLALGGLVLAGCGSKEAEQPAAQQTTEQPAAEHPAAEHPAAEPAGDAAAAVHDCAGACGMTAVPEDQLTEIDGKWYCAACAHKLDGGDHSGHGHG